MNFILDDGGRAAAGYRGTAGDCVCRSIAIAAKRPYAEVYAALSDGSGAERKSKGRSARNGVHVRRKWFKEYMRSLGFTWTACMGIGTGCQVHLRDGELPMGRLVVAVSKHYVAVIDGVVHDTYQDDRDGTRCVYGYWKLNEEEKSPEVVPVRRIITT